MATTDRFKLEEIVQRAVDDIPRVADPWQGIPVRVLPEVFVGIVSCRWPGGSLEEAERMIGRLRSRAGGSTRLSQSARWVRRGRKHRVEFDLVVDLARNETREDAYRRLAADVRWLNAQPV